MRSYNYSHTLTHHGVLGMKWGVRRTPEQLGRQRSTKSESFNDARVISRGTKLQNISEGGARTLNHIVYASYTQKDNANYKSFYAGMMDKPFENQWEVKKDIVIPSQKKAVSKLKELISEDPEGMYAALGKAKVQASLFRSIGEKMGMKLEDKYAKKFSKMGEDVVAEKGFQYFMDTVPAMTPKHKRYIDGLVKEGFSGMTDYHDTKEFGSEDPLIIFKGDSNVKTIAPAKKISEKDIMAAYDIFYELDNKGI